MPGAVHCPSESKNHYVAFLTTVPLSTHRILVIINMDNRWITEEKHQGTLKTDDRASSGSSSLVIYKALALVLINVSL